MACNKVLTRWEHLWFSHTISWIFHIPSGSDADSDPANNPANKHTFMRTCSLRKIKGESKCCSTSPSSCSDNTPLLTFFHASTAWSHSERQRRSFKCLLHMIYSAMTVPEWLFCNMLAEFKVRTLVCVLLFNLIFQLKYTFFVKHLHAPLQYSYGKTIQINLYDVYCTKTYDYKKKQHRSLSTPPNLTSPTMKSTESCRL